MLLTDDNRVIFPETSMEKHEMTHKTLERCRFDSNCRYVYKYVVFKAVVKITEKITVVYFIFTKLRIISVCLVSRARQQ